MDISIDQERYVMLTLPAEIIAILMPFAPLFSQPVFRHAQILLVGALLTPGRRTVTNALRVMGLQDTQRFQNYHRVLNRANWNSRKAAKILLGLLVKAFVPVGTLVMGIDETLERRRGEKIAGYPRAGDRHLPRRGTLQQELLC